ncbi:MAG: arginine repressor [Firmicutes bacterium]|nr:arginine repressor [Bacillota bacterium]
MKAQRHSTIMRIIRDIDVETQEELAQYLRQQGIAVTQATVSRDIKELRLVKIPNERGGYRYAPPFEPDLGDVRKRAQRTFEDFVIEQAFTGNLVILKTLPGTAPAVGAAIDDLEWPDVIATLAGDDVVLVIVKSGESGEIEEPTGAIAQVLEGFRKLRQGK